MCRNEEIGGQSETRPREYQYWWRGKLLVLGGRLQSQNASHENKKTMQIWS